MAASYPPSNPQRPATLPDSPEITPDTLLSATAPDPVTRRSFLGAGSAALALSATVDAQSPGSIERAEHGASGTDPGPVNPPVAQAQPDANLPPPTDKGDVPTFWYSFNLAKKRVQDGGWARQVNVKDLPISTEIAAVNMRLTAGGVRELHWHAAAEWSLMLRGSCRLTAIDNRGKSFVRDVTEGDLWYFPTGVPHSLQGLGPDGCEFLLVFDQGTFSEFDTTLISDWLARTPRSVLAKNWNVPEAALANMPKEELYIYQGKLPGPIEPYRQSALNNRPASPLDFTFRMQTMPLTKTTPSGDVRIVDSSNFPMAITLAAAHVRVKPGGLRELHWHADADEWQYYVSGKGRMTLFINGAKGRTMDFAAKDVGYVPRTFGHYIENTGTEDLVYLEMFRANSYSDFSLNDWITHTPPELVLEHLRITPETLAAVPKSNRTILPG